MGNEQLLPAPSPHERLYQPLCASGFLRPVGWGCPLMTSLAFMMLENRVCCGNRVCCEYVEKQGSTQLVRDSPPLPMTDR